MLQGLAKSICVNAKKGSAADVTPNAVNWNNTSSSALAKTSGFIYTIGQQITAISSSINLTVTNSTDLTIANLAYGVNSTNTQPATFTTIMPTAEANTVSSTFSVSNNEWLFFRITTRIRPGEGSTTLTVTNTSDSNAILDTWPHTNI
jgi:hypothetical protein